MSPKDGSLAGAPAVSVITVVYKTGPALEEFLRAALTQTSPVEVIIVDNGEDPSDHQRIAAYEGDKRLRVLSGHGNIGFAAGCNRGAEAARAPVLWFVNPDAAPPVHAAARLAETLNDLKGLVAVGSTLVDGSGAVDPACRRAPLTPGRAILQGLGLHETSFGRALLGESGAPQPKSDRGSRNFVQRRGRKPDSDPILDPLKPDPNRNVESVGALSGACMMMRARDFADLGGFDARYFLHVEDVDLCRRIRSAGGLVLSVDDVRTPHARSTSGASTAAVEWSKAAGFDRYFRTHFAWWNPLALLARLGGWARFAVRALRS